MLRSQTTKKINDPTFISSVLNISDNLHIKYDNSEVEYMSITDKLCDKVNVLPKLTIKTHLWSGIMAT